jgi:hypothetical protein
MNWHALLRYAALVLAGVIGYLALWWVSKSVGASLLNTPVWFVLVASVLIPLQTVAPAFLVGWISGARGALLGALIGFCGAVVQGGLLVIYRPSSALIDATGVGLVAANALVSAAEPLLIGVVSGMAGELVARRKHAP